VEKGLVAGIVVPDRWRASRDGLLDRDHGGQRLVVDLDQFRSVLGLRQRFGDDESDRLANKAHAVTGKQRLRRDISGGSVALLMRRGRPLRAKPAGLQLDRS
jgi:hypothetical protein